MSISFSKDNYYQFNLDYKGNYICGYIMPHEENDAFRDDYFKIKIESSNTSSISQLYCHIFTQ